MFRKWRPAKAGKLPCYPFMKVSNSSRLLNILYIFFIYGNPQLDIPIVFICLKLSYNLNGTGHFPLLRMHGIFC